MPETAELLELAKSVASRAGGRLLARADAGPKAYEHSRENPKEIKALADAILETDILRGLGATGLPILSEESGFISGAGESARCLIVDPLDGTFNFVKGLGPSAVSIALWEGGRPVFGVIYCLEDRRLVWGGAGLGAYAGDSPIRVSSAPNAALASICTGFPVRMDVANEAVMKAFWNEIKPYAKVRMLGSAAVSLVRVAQGSADAYAERNIMLWDVAAGLAIVEGSGGKIWHRPGTAEYSLNVYAANERLFQERGPRDALSGPDREALRGPES